MASTCRERRHVERRAYTNTAFYADIFLLKCAYSFWAPFAIFRVLQHFESNTFSFHFHWLMQEKKRMKLMFMERIAVSYVSHKRKKMNTLLHNRLLIVDLPGALNNHTVLCVCVTVCALFSPTHYAWIIKGTFFLATGRERLDFPGGVLQKCSSVLMSA